jgi:shikimate dehydrogenase
MQISGKTQVYGIIGHPVEHSLSPVMQSAAFEAHGIDAIYVPFPVKPEDLKSAVTGLDALGVKGVNVTIPHKQEVLELVTDLDPAAGEIGAVNTLKFENGRIYGWNTDAPGFLKSLEIDLGFDPKGKKVLLLGAGGAARGVCHALMNAGISALTISNIFPDETDRLAESAADWSDIEIRKTDFEPVTLSGIVGEADLIVHATSLGLKPNEAPNLPWDKIKKETKIYDIVYNWEGTLLVRQAEEHGCKAAGGLGMLAYQGAISFSHWTGLEPPFEIMRKAIDG